jgi:hypothetical protein
MSIPSQGNKGYFLTRVTPTAPMDTLLPQTAAVSGRVGIL